MSHLNFVRRLSSFTTVCFTIIISFLGSSNLHGLARTVSSIQDAGPNTLRQHIIDSMSGDTILFAHAIDSMQIGLVTELLIDKNIVIIGNGKDRTVIDGLANSRIFNIDSLGTLCIDSITLKNANIVGAGGAIWNKGIFKGSVLCIIDNNATAAAVMLNEGSATIKNSVFKLNQGLFAPGGISNTASGTYVGCNNLFQQCGPTAFGNLGNATFTSSIFNDNAGLEGGAINNGIGGKITVNGCIFNRNQALVTDGGAISNRDTLRIDRCIFDNNTAVLKGGAIFDGGSEISAIVNTTISNNSADDGGGMFLCGNVTITGARITGNQASNGGGIYAGAGIDVDIFNCTIAANTASGSGGGMHIEGANMTIANTIAALNMPLGGDITKPSGTITDLGGNLIGDATGVELDFNVSVQLGTTLNPLNPLFAGNQDFRPTFTSPAINAGIDPSGLNLPLSDLDGVTRVVDEVDIGGYEAQNDLVINSELFNQDTLRTLFWGFGEISVNNIFDRDVVVQSIAAEGNVFPGIIFNEGFEARANDFTARIRF